MYEREWLRTVEEFFREKNRAWLSGQSDTLLHFVAGSPADCHSWQEVRALWEASKRRHAHYRKAKTHLQILSAKWHRNLEHAVVEAVEHVRFFYDQGRSMQDEARKVAHRLTLMPFGGAWRVVRDETDRESLYGGTGVVESLGVDLEKEKRAMAQVRGRYDRVRAYKYAELWWDSYNPAYQRMQGSDCTNYVSQVLYAGGMPMVGGSSKAKGWWYRSAGNNWSYSWAVAHSFCLALPVYLHAVQVGDPRMLKVGDVICYDWEGDGKWNHNTVVVDFDAYGMPLVNAHTIASHRRYYDYRDSYAYTSRTRYLYFHILDQY